jgi:hypothetical protein
MPPRMTTGILQGNWRFFVNLDTIQISSISWEHVNIEVNALFLLFTGISHTEDDYLKNATYFFYIAVSV